MSVLLTVQSGQKYVIDFLQELSAVRMKKLLGLNRNHLKQMTGLLTGDYQVKGISPQILTCKLFQPVEDVMAKNKWHYVCYVTVRRLLY
jgi:hypothetical protein